MQWSESTQEMDVKLATVDGIDSGDHTLPPSVVTMMLGEPDPASKSLTARQMLMLTHEIAVSVPVPDGMVSVTHVAPPSVVPMTTGVPKIPNPTAVQSVVDGQEMPFRPLTSDGIASAVHA